MESVKKSIGERAQHKMEYESRVNERQIQTTEEKTNTSNALDALDASSVIIESNGTESKEQDTSSRSGNDAHVDDAEIRPIYDEEPMAEGSLRNFSDSKFCLLDVSEIVFNANNELCCNKIPERVKSLVGEGSGAVVEGGGGVRLLRGQHRVEFLKTGDLRWVPTGKILPLAQQRYYLRKFKPRSSISTWRLLKITLQAPFLNVQMTFDRSRSSLGLHGNDF
ncbi:hypothetical protein Tco_0323420 [Tanacetum coccineum]